MEGDRATTQAPASLRRPVLTSKRCEHTIEASATSDRSARTILTFRRWDQWRLSACATEASMRDSGRLPTRGSTPCPRARVNLCSVSAKRSSRIGRTHSYAAPRSNTTRCCSNTRLSSSRRPFKPRLCTQRNLLGPTSDPSPPHAAIAC